MWGLRRLQSPPSHFSVPLGCASQPEEEATPTLRVSWAMEKLSLSPRPRHPMTYHTALDDAPAITLHATAIPSPP